MATALDRALESHELRRARDTYALRHGEPGTVAYRAAWLRFQQRIQTIEDLELLRRNAASQRRQRGPSQPVAVPDRTRAPKTSKPQTLVHAA